MLLLIVLLLLLWFLIATAIAYSAFEADICCYSIFNLRIAAVRPPRSTTKYFHTRNLLLIDYRRLNVHIVVVVLKVTPPEDLTEAAAAAEDDSS